MTFYSTVTKSYEDTYGFVDSNHICHKYNEWYIFKWVRKSTSCTKNVDSYRNPKLKKGSLYRDHTLVRFIFYPGYNLGDKLVPLP